MRVPIPSVHRRRVGRPRYADVASTLALLVALGGTAYAVTELPANSVGNAQLKPDAVTATKIAAGAVGHSELAEGAVQGSDVAAESLSLADLVGANVTGKLSFHVDFYDCTPLTINVPGAKEGQAALFSFTNAAEVPEGLVSAPPVVVSAGKVSVQFCTVDTGGGTAGGLDVTAAQFRVVTFG